MTFVVLKFIVATTCAWAIPVAPLHLPSDSVQKADFIPSETAFRNLNVPLSAMAASPQIHFLNSAGEVIDACSSSVVSDSGNLLMAGHCLDACLKSSGAIQDQGGIPVVDRSRLASVSCSIEIDGKRSSAKILATNDCHTKDLAKIASSGIHCQSSDFAILQAQPELTEGRSCFHVATRVPAVGDDVASVGWPFSSYRRFKRRAGDSNGTDQFVSTGKVIPFRNSCDRLTSDSAPVDVVGFDAKNSGDARKQQLQNLTGDGSLIQTYGAEFLKKGSGGGLIDPRTGELLGIASLMINNSQFYECRGSTFFSSTVGMLKALKSDYPDVNLRGVFNCQKKAFTTGADPTASSGDRPRPIPIDTGPSGSSR